jgi:hypothetical protein
MIKDIKIDGKMQRVFVLHSGNNRIAYIPYAYLSQIDYDRLIDLSKKYPDGGMMDAMAKTTLPNNKNMLALYDNLIQVIDMDSNNSGTRLRKPEEPAKMESADEDVEQADIAVTPNGEVVETKPAATRKPRQARAPRAKAA